MPPRDLYVWTLGPWLVGLFRDVVGALGTGPSWGAQAAWGGFLRVRGELGGNVENTSIAFSVQAKLGLDVKEALNVPSKGRRLVKVL